MDNPDTLFLTIGRFQLMKKVRSLAAFLLVLGSIIWVFSSNARPNVESVAHHLGATDTTVNLLLVISITLASFSVFTFLYYLSLRDNLNLIITSEYIEVNKERFELNQSAMVRFTIRDLGIKGYGSRNLRLGGGNYLTYSDKGKELKWEFFIKDKIYEDAVMSFARELSIVNKHVEIHFLK